MKLHTIGYSGKTAQEFFELLKKNKIECLVDIRIYPNHDGAQYASKRDLPYLLKEIADCDYDYRIELAPTPKLLDDIHKDGDWDKYVAGYTQLMEEREIPFTLDKEFFEKQACCLLCFEATAEQCHRRLVAELWAAQIPELTVVHLKRENAL